MGTVRGRDEGTREEVAGMKMTRRENGALKRSDGVVRVIVIMTVALTAK